MGTVQISNGMQAMLDEVSPKSKVAQMLLYGASDDANGNFLDYLQGNITFLPKSETSQHNTYANTKRQSGKCARTARKFLRKDFLDFELTDQDFEIFANEMKAADITEMVEMQLVEGADIKKWYHQRTYAPRNTGSLGASCMRYDECQNYFALYVNNPNQIKMVIAVHKETKKLVGRALVWYTQEGDVVMDRVYGNDAMIVFFQNYGKSQGWLVRTHNSYTNERTFTTPDGKDVDKRWKVVLDNPNATQYPYMDTFKYYNQKEGWISNDSRTNYAATLQHTRGGIN